MMYQQHPPEQYPLPAMGTQGYAYREDVQDMHHDGSEGYQDDKEPNDSYKKYTEGGGGKQIDPDSGIAPRGLTDCVVMWLFLAYVMGMAIIVMYAKTLWIGSHPYGDINRLSYAMDEQARLCGIDKGVEDKPFLFYCRGGNPETHDDLPPTILNLDHPTCVKKCPVDNSGEKIPCLYAKDVEVVTLEGAEYNAFGNIKTFHLTAEQNVVKTVPYETVAFGGRYCVPKNSDLKATILGFRGPMNPLWRLRNAAASFKNPWFVLFLCSILAVVLGYVYLCTLYKLRSAGTCMVGTFLVISSVLSFTGFFFFAWGGLGIVVKTAGMDDLLGFNTYKELNPLYGRFTTIGASIISLIISIFNGAVGFTLMFVFFDQVAHGDPQQGKRKLLKVPFEMVFEVGSLVLTPLVLALAKFLACWTLATNFMYLASVGTFEDRRIEVNGERYMGADKTFKFDWGILPWMLYYIYGSVWIMEVINAIGQFLTSFCVVSWYFMKKEEGLPRAVPHMPIWKGMQAMLCYHMGSVFLGAAMVPMYRTVRLLNWPMPPTPPPTSLLQSKPPTPPNWLSSCGRGCKKIIGDCMPAWCKPKLPDDSQAKEEERSWMLVGAIAFACTSVLTVLMPATVAPGVASSGAFLVFLVFPSVIFKYKPELFAPGASYRYTKDAYADVIIRSNHFFEASRKAQKVLFGRKSCLERVIEGKGLQVVTISGATTIGIVCTAFCYLLLTQMHNLEDPKNPKYIADPFWVCVMCFLLCGPCIGYGFTMLVDHTFDTILYCYAHHRKYNKDNGGAPVSDYLPDSMAEIVNNDDDDDNGLYGRARPNMYLNTWMPEGWFPSKKDSARTQTATPSASASTGYRP